MAATAAMAEEGSALADRFRQLRKDSDWREVATHEIGFRTGHPQGMTKVGDRFFLSSVEVIDRKAEKGVGHLYEMSPSGALLREITLGEGPAYHPGGIDFDGRLIWVPVAEYRPDSSAIVYAVDPATLKPREVFRFKDHLGAISHFPDKKCLVGVSWGSRTFYRWKTEEGPDGWTVPDPARPEATPNPTHYIDYQDSQRIPGTPFLLCGGLQGYKVAGTKLPGMKLGGIDLVNVEDMRPVHQVPVPLRLALAPAWTQNPLCVEPSDTGLRFYFIPEDQKSSIHIFEVKLP